MYDTLNRLQTLTPPSAFTGTWNFGFSYDALSRRTQMTRPNQVTTNYGYDNLSRLLSVLHKLGAVTLDGASYTVDNAGNRTSKTDQLAGVTSNYGYDAIYQLLQATQGATTTESYTYDPVGNRLSSLGLSPYNYNVSNQLTATPSASYTYDSNGNTLTKTDSTGTTNYTWDFENRLTSVTLPGSGRTVSFKYDPFGRRIQKVSSAGTSIFAYDGTSLVEETNAAGAVVARYAQGLDIDEALAEVRSGTTSYYEQDGLGSVTSLTSAAGLLAQTYTYDSFGKLTTSAGSITNSLLYTGREFDTETGLYFYRARYYNQSTGRFLSEDPARFNGGGVDFYRYVNNNSINFIDPTGLAPSCKNCQIVVRCRGIESYHLGMLGFKHCDARVVDSNGETHSLSGGADPASNGELLNFWDATRNLPPFTGIIVYFNARANCGTVNCLINAANNFHNDSMHLAYIPYGGPNSNTALNTIFAACGINLNLHWWGPPAFQLPFWQGK